MAEIPNSTILEKNIPISPPSYQFGTGFPSNIDIFLLLLELYPWLSHLYTTFRLGCTSMHILHPFSISPLPRNHNKQTSSCHAIPCSP